MAAAVKALESIYGFERKRE